MMQIALADHQAGRLDLAAAAYQQVLQLSPNYAEALNALGTIARQQGRLDEAARLIGKAIAQRPSADHYFNLGEACRAAGRLAESIDAYHAALRLDPSNADVGHALALAYWRQGKEEDAIGQLRHALDTAPSHFGALEDLAGLLAKQGDFEEAKQLSLRAIAAAPRRAAVYAKHAAVLAAMRDYPAALAAYQRAAELRPDWARPWVGIGQVLALLHRFAESETACRRALVLDPQSHEAANQLGLSLQRRGKISEAIGAFERSIALSPSSAEAHSNLGVALLHSLRHTEAIQALQKSVMLNPRAPAMYSTYLHALNYADGLQPDHIVAEHRKWPLSHADGIQTHDVARTSFSETKIQLGQTGSTPVLRVGYVSADLWEHPVSRFIEAIFAGHDRTAVEPFVYSDAAHRDAVTARLRQLNLAWRDVSGWGEGQLYDQIRADRIDILVDLAGHTAGNRLPVFARKPARIQVTYLGYPNTTGLSASIMNYRLTDEICDPPGDADALHTEKLIRLPAPFLCYQPPNDAPEVNESPANKTGVVTFGCFNGMMKITMAMIELWSEILRQVPGSRLLLKNRSLADERLRARVREQFKTHGIAEERILLSGPEPTAREHLARYHEVDVALDTYSYHGTTTTCEALWMGVPVVTLVGNAHRSRVGLTLPSSVALQNLAAPSRQSYVQHAVELASDASCLAQLRASLRAVVRDSGLTSRKRFVAALEKAYCHMQTDR